MTDKIRDKATREAVQRLHDAIQELEGGAHEDRTALRDMHQLLLVIDGLLNVATFRPMEERLAMIREELRYGFDVLNGVGIDGDTGRDVG